MGKPSKSTKSDSGRVESSVKDTVQLFEKCVLVYESLAKTLDIKLDRDLIERNLNDALYYVNRSSNISLEYVRGGDQGPESLETLKGLYDLNLAPKGINNDGKIVVELDALVVKEMDRVGIRGTSDLIYRLAISAALSGQKIDIRGSATQEERYVLTDDDIKPPLALVVQSSRTPRPGK